MGRFFSKSWVCAILLTLTATTCFAQSTKIKIACIGNSITAGYLLKDAAHESYPAQLQKLSGDKYDVKNFGYSGATLLKKGHKPYYKTAEFIAALDFKPNIVIIHLGLNDTDPRNWPNYKDEFAANYSWLIDTLRYANPSVKIFICRLSPIFSGHPRFKSGTRDWYWQIQEQIPQIAKANGTGIIDLYEPLHNRPDLFADNLHPNAEGAGIIARTVYQVISGDYGGLSIPSFYSDDMVLQRQQPIRFYGKANAGTSVEINFNLHKQKTVADENGNWKFLFPALQAGGPYKVEIKNEQNEISFKNILIGDVWLCSGQSNMAFELKNAINAQPAILQASANKNLRLFKYNQLAETNNVSWDLATLDKINKLQYFSGTWNTADANTAADFSAIAIFFANKIAVDENIPVGLIQVAVGGSPIESWISRYAMEKDEQLVDMLNNWRKSDFFMPWVRERADMNLKNSANPNQRHPYDPAYNFESAIDSLSHFPVKGVLWYQGESNAHNAEIYPNLFKAMVTDWRKSWSADLPFYYVQLSSIDRPSWPYFREMQFKLQQSVPNVFMAVSSDLGDSLDVHPKQKKEIGERLALLAEKYTYKKSTVATGPVLHSAIKQGKDILLELTSTKKLTTSGNKPLTGFELVNDKGIFIPVQGIISNNKIRLSIPVNEKIIRIVYGWKPFTRANLVNEAGLPASTFSISINAKEK